ncbi:MAG TPA: TonB family protein [Noviherbaspirillum sp.]
MRSSPQPPGNHVEDRYRARLTGAMLFSLALHGLILSMQFGIPGLGLPTLELPWRDRRAQAIALQVVLADAGRSGEATGMPDSAGSPSAPDAPPPVLPTPAGALKLYPPPVPKTPAAKDSGATKRPPKRARPAPPPRKPPPRAKKETAVIALAEPRPDSFVVAPPALDEALPIVEPPEPAPEQRTAEPAPAEPPAPPTDIAAEPPAEEAQLQHHLAAAQEEEKVRQEEETRRLALEEHQREEARREAEEAAQREQALALQRQKEEQLAREREEALRQQAIERAAREALALQASRQAEEAARHQAALALQRQQAEEALAREREEEARRAMELEAKRREEAQRLDAVRLEREASALAARKAEEEAERQRQAALERQRLADELAARQRAEAEAAASARRREQEADLARGLADAARPSAGALPRDLLGGGLAGRALDQARRSEIFRSDAPVREPDTAAPDTRRRSILGRIPQDVGLMMYVESWKLKIERNGNLNYQPSSAERARGDPIVTVAIRSDGSVETVVIHRSSGRPELDEAVRRIVRLNARYSAFPPELARRFDVIEIRRVWNFDDRLRILEEVN